MPLRVSLDRLCLVGRFKDTEDDLIVLGRIARVCDSLVFGCMDGIVHRYYILMCGLLAIIGSNVE